MVHQPLRWYAGYLPLLLASACPILAEAADDPLRSIPARVVCPAIDLDDRPRTNSPFETSGQPELIVLGTAKKRKSDDRESPYDVTIDKVLYGAWKEKTLQFNSDYSGLEGRQIFALTRSIYEGDSSFEYRYSYPAAEEKAVAAVCAARSDYNALSAVGVFVAKELEANRADNHLVEILRVLSGPDLREGQRLRVTASDHLSNQEKRRRVHSEPEIYFISEIKNDRGESSPGHRLACRLPVDLEKQVQAALERRDEYPVVESNEYGGRDMVREVMFRGSTADSLELLGSASQGAVNLGSRFLIHNRKKTLNDLLAALNRDLFRHTSKKPGDFRGLRELIAALGHIERLQATGDLSQLIDQAIAHIASHPSQPPVIKRKQDWMSRYYSEEQLTDFNHDLAWLLMEMDQSDVQKQYGSKLMELRDRAEGRWKDEVQLALDVGRVEDAIELKTAMARMSNVKPVRSQTQMMLDYPYALAFSHDGKYLATANISTVCIWNVKDWSLAASFPLEGSRNQVRFSANDKLLYVAGGGGGLQIHARYDWRTGKLDKAFRGHKSGVCEMELSADERVMATSNFYEKVFHVWDIPSGKIRKSFQMNELNTRLALSPDGKTLIRATGKDTWAIESLDREPAESATLTVAGGLAFTPEGRYLVTTEQRPAEDQDESAGKAPVTIKLRDVGQGYKEVASRAEVGLDSMPIISADGKRLVLHNAGPRGGPRRGAIGDDRTEVDFAAFTLPKLERISKFKLVSPRRVEMESMALSPDGKILAVAAAYRNPYLFDTDTGKPILPVAAHSDRITSLHFLEEHKKVRTIGRDSSICLWDAATMKLLSRILLPVGCEIKAVREPDGKYVVCYFPHPKNTQTAKVFDSDTGKIVSEIALPRHGSWKNDIQWLNDREVMRATDEVCCVLDCLTGKVLREFKTADSELGYPSPDGKALFTIDGGFRMARGSFGSIDTATGEKVELGKFQFDYGTGNWRGLVPGGKYFYLGNPGMYFIDRNSFKVVGAYRFRGMNLISHSFCNDGNRYALAVRDELFVGRERVHDDRHVKSVVRVIETLSGKTQQAFVGSTSYVQVKLSPDGKRLGVINADNTVEIRDLPTPR
jgi:WD40 repeat protein